MLYTPHSYHGANKFDSLYQLNTNNMSVVYKPQEKLRFAILLFPVSNT